MAYVANKKVIKVCVDGPYISLGDKDLFDVSTDDNKNNTDGSDTKMENSANIFLFFNVYQY